MRDEAGIRPKFLRRWNVAVDLGTANIRVAVRKRGIVYDQPAVIALDRRSGTVVAAGTAAKSMIGRTPPHLEVRAPFRGGFDDTAAAHHLLARALAEGRRHLRLGRPRVLLSMSRSVPLIESSAMARLMLRVGAADVHLVDGLAVTSLGAQPMRTRPRRMVLANLGARTTECALIDADGIAASAQLQLGGDDVDAVVARHVRGSYGIEIGDLAAERVKLILVTTASPEDASVRVRGWDAAAQAPRFEQISAGEVRDAVTGFAERFAESVANLIEDAPGFPEEVLERGVVLAGGSARLAEIAPAIRARLGLPAVLTDQPARTAALGASTCLDRPRLIRYVTRSPGWAATSTGSRTGDEAVTEVEGDVGAGTRPSGGGRRLTPDDSVVTVVDSRSLG